MGVTVFHSLTATTPDNTQYEIKPSNWNSNHFVSLSLQGSDLSGAFSNSPTVTFGTSGGLMTASVNTAYVALSNSSSIMPVASSSNFLGTAASGSFIATSVSSSIMPIASSSNFLGSAASGSFIATGNSSLFQQTSATSAITSAAFPSAQTTKFAGTGTTFAGTNISATIGLNSNGLALSLSGNTGGGGGGGIAAAAGSQTQTSGTVLFSNSNGITFGMSNSSVITASHNGLTTAMQSNAGSNFLGTNTALTANGVSVTANSSGLSLNFPVFLTSQSNQAFSASGGSSTFQTLNFANSNGVTFSNSGGSVIASVPATSSISATGAVSISTNGNTISIGAPAMSVGLSNLGNTSGNTGTVSNQFVLAGGNNITLSGSTNAAGMTVTVSANTAAAANLSVSAGTTSGAFGGITFANSNNVTFGLNNGTITASAPSGGGGGVAIANSQTTYTSGTVSFRDGNGITFASGTGQGLSATHALQFTSATSAITSAAFPSAQTTKFAGTGSAFTNLTATFNTAGLSISAPATSSISATGAVSISTNGNTISIGAPAFSAGVTTLGNTSGNTGTVSNQLVLAGGNNITLSGSTNAGGMTLTISGPNIGGAQTGISGLVVSNTTYTSGTVSFRDGNGITFASGTGQGVSLTHGLQFTSATSAITASALNTSQSSLFQHTSATSAITSAAFPSAQTTKFAGTGTTFSGTNVSGSITLNSNGLNIALSAPNVAGAQTGISGIIAGTQTQTAGTVSFANSNGITFGMSNSSVITASYTVPTVPAQSYQPVALSGSNGSSTASTFTFGNLNGLSHYITNGSLVASYTVPTVPAQSYQPVALSGSNGSSTASTFTFGNLNGLSHYITNGSLVASYTVPTQSNLAFSASGGSSTFQTLNFANSNGVTFSNSGGSVIASVPGTSSISATGAVSISTNGNTISIGAPAFSAGVTTLGNTLGNTGTVSNQLVLAGGNNITLSGSTAAGGMTLTISGPNVGGAQTGISGLVVSNTTYTSGTVSFRDGNGITFASGTGQGVSLTHGLQFTSNTSAITASALNTSQSSLFQQTSATSAITSNALNTSASRVINLIAATDNAGAGTASLSSNVSFGNTNGITFYTSAGNVIAVNHALQFTSATSAITSAALNTSQSSLFQQTSATSAITSAAFPSAQTTKFAGTGTTFSGTNVSGSITLNSNGLNLALSAPAAAGAQTAISGLVVSNTTYTSGTVSFRDGNGITFASGTGQGLSITHGLQFTSATSAITSNALNTSQSSLFFQTSASSVFLQTSQSSLFQHTSATSAITSAAFPSAQTTKFAGTGTTFSGTNVSGSITLNSNGLNLALSAGAGGGGGVVFANSQTTYTSGTVSLREGGGAITIASNTGQRIDISVPAVSSIYGTNGILVSSAGSSISIQNDYNKTWEVMPLFSGAAVYSTASASTLAFMPLFPQDNYTFSGVQMLGSFNVASNTRSSYAASHTISYALYSVNQTATTMSQLGSSSLAILVTASSNARGAYTISYDGANSVTSSSLGTGLFSAISGQKVMNLLFASSLVDGGAYALGIGYSSTAANAAEPLSAISFNQIRYLSNISAFGVLDGTNAAATANSYLPDGVPFVYSATSGGWPSTIGFSQRRQVPTYQFPYVMFRGT